MTDDMRSLRTEMLAALLDAAVGFYALNVTFERPDLTLDEEVQGVLREAIREAAHLVGRAAEPRIAAIVRDYPHNAPGNAQELPETAKIPPKTRKSPKRAREER